MTHSYLHLKICEGCGRLWIRNNTVTGVYCRRCTVRLSDFPLPLSRRRTGRPRRAKTSLAILSTEGGLQ
jgi:hypothetical protein